MAKLVDALRLGRNICNGYVGSNPTWGTKKK